MPILFGTTTHTHPATPDFAGSPMLKPHSPLKSYIPDESIRDKQFLNEQKVPIFQRNMNGRFTEREMRQISESLFEDWFPHLLNEKNAKENVLIGVPNVAAIRAIWRLKTKQYSL